MAQRTDTTDNPRDRATPGTGLIRPPVVESPRAVPKPGTKTGTMKENKTKKRGLVDLMFDFASQTLLGPTGENPDSGLDQDQIDTAYYRFVVVTRANVVIAACCNNMQKRVT